MEEDGGFAPGAGVSFRESRVLGRKVLSTCPLGFTGRLFLSGADPWRFWWEMAECAWNHFRDKHGMVKIEQN